MAYGCLEAYAHLMQAYLAEEKATEAKQMLEKIKKLPDVPSSCRI